jgi:septal ring factor EnvC (AmiA/AmiB activator)
MSMSMIPIQGFSQLVLTGTVEAAKENSTALEQVLTVLAESDDRVAIGAQKTAQQFEQFMKQMQERFTILSEENCKLREQLIASNSRQRELEVLHRTEIQAITDKVSSAETSVETMRQEMAASARSAEARVAAAVAAQIEAVKTGYTSWRCTC